MKIDLELGEVNTLLEVLSQGPFRAVAPLIQKIQMQVMMQQAAAQAQQPAAPDNSAGGTD